MPADIPGLLTDIEQALKALGWWQDAPPSPEALASTQPFCVDTLSLPQWLQFVLLPRLRALVAAGSPLPTRIAVYPMAVESFRGMKEDTQALAEAIAQLDEALSGQRVVRDA
ncbi:hypothetical protein GU3_06995 [Oceanimonas sp. GK1]|uniref:YqcC family protein n=1 Tax=Oceanimonas sp. (strain GK1 / IBRC-M 10197) TaxID=511062 RepID=UPI00024956A9|nr:YqcC family protein [Oceanimonas sp. GK1]AEY01155.1 hypothetical protein GU3_06995 [Oceanimonas sp. GK1]